MSGPKWTRPTSFTSTGTPFGPRALMAVRSTSPMLRT